MLGAIIGDIVGSTREWNNIKTEEFEMVPQGSRFTDDTVMTLAVAQWLMLDPTHSEKMLIACMQSLGRKYIHAGYGSMFRRWLMTDNPKPYKSYGNGSAMRVSPVGLYAQSLEEALELARITASVTHNHREGIIGAQAVAACVYLSKNGESQENIKQYIEKEFGYNLDINLENIRDEYTFDVTCQGSVPIAIMAYLQRDLYPLEKSLRLAISMGGDSDTIGCMTCAISSARPTRFTDDGISDNVVKQCRELMPSDLLDINDRFEAFVSRPLYQSFIVDEGIPFFAGEYPGDKNNETAEHKIREMLHFGVNHFIDLTEENELKPYNYLLPKEITYDRFPLKDCGVPESLEYVYKILNRIDELVRQGDCIYLHCWGGVGRSGTIVACYLARQMRGPTLENVLSALRIRFSKMPKAAHRKTPDTMGQVEFIRRFIDSCPKYKCELHDRIHDSIRGSMMAGAAGDALGYPVEFMSRNAILSKYGRSGISIFEIDSNGKALVSDDTQMTLFTANGMLMGITRGYMRGIGGRPEKYVDGAYLDWYYTQTGRKKEYDVDDFHYTWLRDLPQLAHRRAPGNTCLSACECLRRGGKVENNSKGCGGIMRVAPMGLLLAGYQGRNDNNYSASEMAEAGAEIAEVTHKHPLGFLPACMLTYLLFRLVPLSVEESKSNIDGIVEESIKLLDSIYKNNYERDKIYLADLTRKAVALAHSEFSDEICIPQLGEGWTGEEAWAIALYCSIRHIDSVRDAIMAAVNHNGDSDSTGAVTGNIMGAIHGYKAIKEQRLFCPDNMDFENTLELSNIILALADDLSTSCIISEYDYQDTSEKRQWYERYCEMVPSGIR